ncbi:hypothetical protein D4R71_05675 [bacterium]|nr:MAG: hypothetical protein D4R71_05675 [bacterium]
MNYKVDKPFNKYSARNGKAFSELAIKVKCKENNKEKEYIFIEPKKIYKWISEKKDINLNNCYIKDFSLREYRRITKKGDGEYVTLRNFSAECSFFDCSNKSNNIIDFSWAKFTNDNISFNRSCFVNGNVWWYHIFGQCNKCNFRWSK